MLNEKECRVIAGRQFAEGYGISRLVAVKDRAARSTRRHDQDE
jgi:hypothetical protein